MVFHFTGWAKGGRPRPSSWSCGNGAVASPCPASCIVPGGRILRPVPEHHEPLTRDVVMGAAGILLRFDASPAAARRPRPLPGAAELTAVPKLRAPAQGWGARSHAAVLARPADAARIARSPQRQAVSGFATVSIQHARCLHDLR